jgi:hypothetical protein
MFRALNLSAAALVVLGIALTGCSATQKAPVTKTYRATSVRVVDKTAYVEARVTKTKIRVTYTCDIVAEKDCAVLNRDDTFKAVVVDGRLEKVDKQ